VTTAAAPAPAAAPPAADESAPTAATLAASLPVRPGEDPWTAEELEEVRAELEADAARLRREVAESETEIADLLRDSGEGAGDDQADAGTKTFEREHELSLAANARDMLAQTEHALERIGAGTYGVCESCGQAIGKARLQAFPRATLDVACKQREERR
jgi:RNA polymerase-binding protein DksA